MGARQKLNRAHFTGDLVVASIAGALTQSWWVFFLTLAVLAAFDLHTGDVRFKRRDK